MSFSRKPEAQELQPWVRHPSPFLTPLSSWRSVGAEVILVRVYPTPEPTQEAGPPAIDSVARQLRAVAGQAADYLSRLAARIESAGVRARIEFRIEPSAAEGILAAAKATEATAIARRRMADRDSTVFNMAASRKP